MYFEIDVESSEAIYSQLKNRIIYAIAMSEIAMGDYLPSVRELAERVGINMHTVNKTYNILKDEGYVEIGRRGAYVCVTSDVAAAKKELYENMYNSVAKALVKNVSKNECKEILSEVLDSFYVED